MSLIGSLEDLGLGDILQIIHLSQKSGVLSIRGASGEGRIVFQEGLVRLANLKGDPDDLRGLLVDRGFVTPAVFDEAANIARNAGESLAVVLSRQTDIGLERIESLRRECAENAVGAMFSWTSGEFSFDVGAEDDFLEGEMALSTGVNAQYMAMESLRVRDERGRAGAEQAHVGSAAQTDATLAEDSTSAEPEAEHPGFELPAEEMFGVVDDSEPVAEALIEVAGHPPVDAESSAQDVEILPEAQIDPDIPIAEAEPAATEEPILEADLAEPEPAELEAVAIEEPPVVEATAPAGPRPPVVVIHESLAVLDWVRGALAPAFPSVHIFQRSQEGLGRIRQYLARAQAPILLVAPAIEGSPLSGIADAADFVRRLREQSSRMPILWLHMEADGDDAVASLPLDLPAVCHPDESVLGEVRGAAGDLASRLREAVIQHVDRNEKPVAESAPAAATSDDLGRLKTATETLSQSSSTGEILPLVLRFASETFARVAMWMVRGDEVLGMAQLGIEAGGGPDDIEMRALRFARGESARFARVIESAQPLRAEPAGQGDERLCSLLGARLGVPAYVAPILSSDQVVALLYADNGAEPPPADTSALEVVLHHAGLALDRAALERALVEPDA